MGKKPQTIPTHPASGAGTVPVTSTTIDCQKQADPSDKRPRVGVLLSFHPVLFRSGEFPAKEADFYVIDGKEFPTSELLADGLASAVIQVRLVRLDATCKLPKGTITTATAADHSNEGEVILRLSNKQSGDLSYNAKKGGEIRIQVSEITNGMTTLDLKDARVVKFVTSREIGLTDITASIEGNNSYIYCSEFELPAKERQWKLQLPTGSRQISTGMRGFDCRKVQWYLRRFGFLGYDLKANVDRRDSTNPWTNISELKTDGDYGARSARAYRDFTILSTGKFRNQANADVMITYTGSVGETVNPEGITEFLQWEAKSYRVEEYHGLFDIQTASITVQTSILYNAIVVNNSYSGYLTLGTPIGGTSFHYGTTTATIADEIRCAIKLFRGTNLEFRLHDADPSAILDDANLHATLAANARLTVAAIRREQVAAFTGASARDVLIHSGYRSHAEQQTIYDRGRTTPGEPCKHNGVPVAVGTCPTHPFGATATNALPGSSWHNFGCAIDLVFCNAKGQPTWPDGNNWARNGALAQANGLTWGGNWTNPDTPHIQNPAAASPSQAVKNAYTNTQGTVLQKLQAAWALI